jgi:hypothetical protein
MRKKVFFASHAKSSAALVSLGIHAVLIIVALSFVAVTVIQKEEKAFEAKPVKRPKMSLKKLQVPVNIKKKKMQRPKLRKRIVVQPKMNQNMTDIKMPEISGVKCGLGAGAGGGLGGSGGIGFSMLEFEIFGIKGKGEKVFIALDSSPNMMLDEVGGMRAYTLIKDELGRIIDGLPPTALFNIAVFDHNNAFALFPSMVSASAANKSKVDGWLSPLNAVTQRMAANAYGVGTLPPGGTRLDRYNDRYGKIKNGRHWYPVTAAAMQQQADAVFILSGFWGPQWHKIGDAGKYTETQWEKYHETNAKAHKRWEEENKARAAKGEPPRVFENEHRVILAYFPGFVLPPMPELYHYTAKDFEEALQLCRKEYAPQARNKSGLSKRKKKDRFSVNVVFFEAAGGGSEGQKSAFRKLCSLFKGDFRSIKGLDAIESYISAAE